MEKYEVMRVRLTMIEPILGTSPANEDVYMDFIGSKAPNAATMEEEIESLGADAYAEKGMTVFLRTDDGKGGPMLLDYQIKGFFKDACQMLNRLKGRSESSKLKAYKKVIDGLIFPFPREIPIIFDGEIRRCQRPLRAQTMQGERVTISMSEEIPAGATLEFGIRYGDPALLPVIREWLDYGELRGLGQWRNSGKGRFVWEELTDEKAP